jgi:hypothetical protein
MKPHSINFLSQSLSSIRNFYLLDVFLSLTAFSLLTVDGEGLLDVLTSNGNNINITAGEMNDSYKIFCCVK